MGERFERQKDDASAFKYYKLSAELGDTSAPLKAALAAHRKKCYNEAIYYLEMAISRTNDAEAHTLLGKYYYLKKAGHLFNRNKKAFEHFLAAAKQGNPEAQYIVSIMYSDGEGAPKSIEQYIFWLRCSQLNGFPEAIRRINICMNENEHMHRVWEEELIKADKKIAGHEKYIEEYFRRKAREQIDAEEDS